MKEADWEQVKDVFYAALDKPLESRDAFLDSACGSDEQLRGEVDVLLGSYDSSYLERPILEETPKPQIRSLFKPDELINHYKIIKSLGRGGMGEVYLANDKKLDRPVAIKLLHEGAGSSSQADKRLLREARSAARLEHPNICSIYEVGETNGRPFIVMQYVEGHTLEHLIKSSLITLESSIAITRQIAEALGAAHSRGIVHRDIKPANMIIDSRGRVTVLDFSLAKRFSFGESDNSESELSVTGAIAGTVSYMSPEQARGLELDERTDIWSLGIVFYEMLTKHLPFPGETKTDIIASILHKDFTDPNTFLPVMPSQAGRIVALSLQKDRDARYQTTTEMIADLDILAAEAGVKGNAAKSSENIRSLKNSNTVEGGRGISTEESARAFAAESRQVKFGVPPSTGDPEKQSTQFLSTGTVSNISSAEYFVTGIQRYKGKALIAAAMLILVTGGLGFGIYRIFEYRAERSAKPAPILKIQRLTGTGNIRGAAISPDEKFLAYSQTSNGKESLWVKQISNGSSIQLISGGLFEDITGISSLNGGYIYFSAKEAGNPVTKVFRIPIIGGQVAKITTDATGPNKPTGYNVSPDGKQVIFQRANLLHQIMIANADGSNERELISLPQNTVFNDDLGWSPDGKYVLIPMGNADSKKGFETLWVIEVSSGTIRQLTDHRWDRIAGLAWLPTMAGIVFAADETGGGNGANTLWEISYPEGKWRQLSPSLNSYHSISATSDSKTLVAVETGNTSDVWVSPNANPNDAVAVPVTKDTAGRGIAWTPDKKS